MSMRNTFSICCIHFLTWYQSSLLSNFFFFFFNSCLNLRCHPQVFQIPAPHIHLWPLSRLLVRHPNKSRMSHLLSFSIRQIIPALYWFQLLSTMRIISLGNVPWRWLSMPRTNLASLIVLSQSQQNPNLMHNSGTAAMPWFYHGFLTPLIKILSLASYHILWQCSGCLAWSWRLEARFSQSNNPWIYKLKQDISPLKQESMSISSYYTTIKSYWDELSMLTSAPPCTCGTLKTLHQVQETEQVFQFSIG